MNFFKILKKDISTPFLEKRKYKGIDILRLPFKVAPFLISMYILLSILQAIVPTFLVTVTTAFFLDTALLVFSDEIPIDSIYLPLVLLIISIYLTNILDTLSRLIESRIRIEIERKFTPEILKIRANLKYEHIEDSESFELSERVSNGIVRNLMGGIISYKIILRSIISILIILGIVVTHVWWSALLISLLSFLLFKIAINAGKKNYDAWMEAWPYEHRFTYYSDEVLTSRDATYERTLFGYSEYVAKLHYKHFEIARKIQEKVSRKTKIIMGSTGISMLVIALLVSFTLINPVMYGYLSSGMFMGITISILGISTTLGGSLQEASKTISYSKRGLDDLTKFMHLNFQDGATDLPDLEPIIFKNLSFNNVSFKYRFSKEYILKNLSFEMESGKHYAFVGANGSGKTTIIKLLTGLYREYEGEILINGKELRKYPLSTLKSMFSVIYQDFAKYEISLLDNISLGNTTRKIESKEISDIFCKIGFTDTITNLIKEIHTPLGKINSNGVDLSGGEWQKVAIARSFISSAPIKILDEPTAALDPISESKMYEEFEELMKEKTSIFISHRLGSTKFADEIFVIDSGNIVEKGSHKELMSEQGIYYKMFESQRNWYNEKNI
ncbi:MAG: ABC transporter ATP-binding protein/permease [Defluviitaleaceae bacterium]|nr:ABC transporter ATP-binding protein/permease [Defluviitaleaceae bacterium]